MSDSHWGFEWELVTEKGIEALVLAQREAQFLRDPHVGTEHLLVGLLSSHNVGAALLLESAVDIHGVRATLEKLRTREESQEVRRFSYHLRKVVERALEEARAAGQAFVSTDHLYLGVLAQDGCRAVRILADLGVDCAELARRLRGHGEKPVGSALPDAEQLLVQLQVREDDIPALERLTGPSPSTSTSDAGHPKLGLEHLLRVLDELGQGLQAAQQSVQEALRSEPVPALLIAAPDQGGWPVVDEEAYQIGGLVSQILAGAVARRAERVVFEPRAQHLEVAYHVSGAQPQCVRIPSILRYVVPFKVMRMALINPLDKSRESEGRLTIHVRGRSYRMTVRSEPVLKGFRVEVLLPG